MLLSGFIGAFIGATATLLFNFWKVLRDERNARSDELCKAIVDLSAAAAEYWAKKYQDRPSQVLQEAKILSLQAIIDGLYADQREILKVKDQRIADTMISDLYDAMSGGQFTEAERDLDLDRVTRASTEASLVVVMLRRAYRQSLPLHRLHRAYLANQARELDMPPGFGERHNCSR